MGIAHRIVSRTKARKPTSPKTRCLPGMTLVRFDGAIEWRFVACVMGMADPRPSRRAITTSRLTPILSQRYRRFVTLLLKSFFVLLTMAGLRKSLSRVSRFEPIVADRTVPAPVQSPAKPEHG